MELIVFELMVVRILACRRHMYTMYVYEYMIYV
jgi:hypothetical protein